MNKALIAPIIILLVTMTSCTWNDPDLSLEFDNLEGNWIYQADTSQTIHFLSPSEVNVNEYFPFTYEISGNEIELTFVGVSFIYVPPTTHEIALDDDGNILRIGNLENLATFNSSQDNVFEK